MLKRCAPIFFVCIWSTGFIVARAIAPETDPCLFLTARFGLTALILAAMTGAAGLPWPGLRLTLGHLAVGGLYNGAYLAAGYEAVRLGLSPGLMALVGALQPPLTALLAACFWGESFSLRRGVGMGSALAGVGLAVWPALDSGGAPAMPPAALALAGAGVLAVTVGALLQKTALRDADLRPAGALQHGGAALVTTVLALVWGERQFAVSPNTLSALAWSVAGLSLGGSMLLVWLLRQAEAARATSLLLLAPPLAAVWSWAFFGAQLSAGQIAGFALALGGIGLARADGERLQSLGNVGGETAEACRRSSSKRPQTRAVRSAVRESDAPGRPARR